MKPNGKAVFVEGASLAIGWRDRTRNLSELIFETVRSAIDDAGKGLDGIDSVVLAAHDLVDGRSLSSMVTAPAAGAYLRDEIRYGDDGAAAFAAGVMRVEAGESARSIVAAWGRASEHDVEAVSRTVFDPIFTAPLGLEELHVAGLRAQAWMQAGGDASERRAAASRRMACVAGNPRALKGGGRRSASCHPFDEADLPVWADVVAAVVISGDPSPVRLAGLGQSSDPFWIGDRRLADIAGLKRAAATSLAEAGLDPSDLDVIEVDGLTLFDEAIGLEAVGYAAPGTGLARLASDARCNPSGGGAAGYCAPAMGLARIVETVLQLRGTAGGHQLQNARTGLATGSSVTAAQTHTAVVLAAA